MSMTEPHSLPSRNQLIRVGHLVLNVLEEHLPMNPELALITLHYLVLHMERACRKTQREPEALIQVCRTAAQGLMESEHRS